MTDSLKKAPSIRRISGIRAVWLTFRTRPLIWVFAGVGLLLLPGAWQMWVPRYSQGAGPNSASAIRTSALPRPAEPSPRANVHMRDGGETLGKEPDWSKLRSLTLSSGVASCRPLWTPDAMPLLESLTLFNSVEDHQIIQLCELYDLKSLTLLAAQNLTHSAMERLAAEPRLEFLSLDISGYSSVDIMLPGMLPDHLAEMARKKTRLLRNAESLQWPASLKTLIFEDVHGTSQSRLNEWQVLPNLRSLAIRINPVTGNRLSDEALAALKRFPKLSRLYLREYAGDGQNVALVQQRLLPTIRVRPSDYVPTRGRRAEVILIGGLLVVVMLSMQLSAQFALSGGRLIPHFEQIHLEFAAAIVAVTVVSSFIANLCAGSTATAALGLSGAALALFSVAAKLIRLTMPGTFPGFTNPGLVVPVTVFPWMLVRASLGLFGAEFDWYLRGQHPWFAVVLLAAAVWGVVDMARWQMHLARTLEESGCANVPLGMFDTAGWIEWGRSLGAARESQGKKLPYALAGRDAVMDRFEESMRRGVRLTPLALWRLGNAGSTIKFLGLFAIFFLPAAALGAAAVSASTGSVDFEWAQRWQMIFWPVMGQMLFMLLIFPFTFAWQRRPMLTIELLRPVQRQDWIRTWFRGTTVELAPVFLLTLVFLVGSWSAVAVDNWSLSQLVLTGIGAIGGLVLLASFGMWLLTATSFWLTILGSLIAGAVVFLLIFAFAWLADQSEDGTNLQTSMLLIVLLYTVAYTSLRLSWLRWQRLEVGRIG